MVAERGGVAVGGNVAVRIGSIVLLAVGVSCARVFVALCTCVVLVLAVVVVESVDGRLEAVRATDTVTANGDEDSEDEPDWVNCCVSE
jgi:hypothetical protein